MVCRTARRHVQYPEAALQCSPELSSLGGCVNGANRWRCSLTHQPPSTANVAHPSFARERPHHDMLLLQPAGVSLVPDRIQYRCNPLLVDMHAALTSSALQLSVASSFCRFRCSNLYTLHSMRRDSCGIPLIQTQEAMEREWLILVISSKPACSIAFGPKADGCRKSPNLRRHEAGRIDQRAPDSKVPWPAA